VWPLRRRIGRADFGARGEKLAQRFLKRRGMKILARNYRCPAGEIDLIALDPASRREFGTETIVFVEVKTRSSDEYADPQSAITAEKKRRLRKAADYYLQNRRLGDYVTRFDVIAIVQGDGEKPRIEHFPDAFPWR